MVLHGGDVVPGLISAEHLEFVHDNTTSMQLVDHCVEIGRVSSVGVFNHDELTQLLVKRHA